MNRHAQFVKQTLLIYLNIWHTVLAVASSNSLQQLLPTIAVREPSAYLLEVVHKLRGLSRNGLFWSKVCKNIQNSKLGTEIVKIHKYHVIYNHPQSWKSRDQHETTPLVLLSASLRISTRASVNRLRRSIFVYIAAPPIGRCLKYLPSNFSSRSDLAQFRARRSYQPDSWRLLFSSGNEQGEKSTPNCIISCFLSNSSKHGCAF